jgi:biopolymer transport protein ExbB/TolQ
MAETVGRSRRRGGSLVLGALLSTAFFGVLSTPWFDGSSLRRYCMAHDVEKVTVVMFFWGLADLLVKAKGFRRQSSALGYRWLTQQSQSMSVSIAGELLSIVQTVPNRLRDSWIADRLRGGLEFVQKRGTAEGLDAHLRQLGDTAADRSHASFALVRIIAWMIPILGFLGTVVGITIAVANVSPNQLDSSLTEVTGGLAMAFDATAVALALAMMLMFAYYLTERTESRLLHGVDDLADELLLHRFERDSKSDSPLALTAEAIEGHAVKLIDAQAELWADALAKTADQTRVLLEAQHRFFENQVELMRRESERQSLALARSAEQMKGVEQALAENARLLASIVKQGSALAPLQASLAENLSMLRQTQGLDDAIHSLTAAIHLMTARARTTGYEKAA